MHRDRLLWMLVACVALSVVSVPLCVALLVALNVAYFGALGGARCCVVVVEWLDGAEGWR